jgi:hypothetical protein
MLCTRKKPRREDEKNCGEQSPEHPQLDCVVSESRRLAHGLDHPVNNGRALIVGVAGSQGKAIGCYVFEWIYSRWVLVRAALRTMN